jgi:hypothetical protein
MRQKFLTLAGKDVTVTFEPSDYPIKSAEQCRSKLQFNCGQVLKEYFPSVLILEDFPTPEGFYLDFYIPSRKRAFEVQGEQHYKYNSFFYKNEKEFKNAKERDSRKREWCRKNNIELKTIDTPEELRAYLNEG